MIVTRRGLAAVLVGIFATAFRPAVARDSEASAKAQGLHSRVRLVAGGPGREPGTRLAGIVIELDAGFKTYWRHPGESGLPPSFGWRGSENLAKAEVLWPAPSRFEDAGGVSYGYKEHVIFPVEVTPADRSRPVVLKLALDYGVCKDICIPASAALVLVLDKVPGRSAVLEEALGRVPKPQPLGADGTLSILALRPAPDRKPAIRVPVRAPAEAALFVEAPDSWYFAPGALEAPADEPGATGRFTVEILERPREPADTIELRLTLVAGARAIETVASLDTAQLRR
jgi:DsbC/DsbD-like thiol-disulfide interchange protein